MFTDGIGLDHQGWLNLTHPVGTQHKLSGRSGGWFIRKKHIDMASIPCFSVAGTVMQIIANHRKLTCQPECAYTIGIRYTLHTGQIVDCTVQPERLGAIIVQ